MTIRHACHDCGGVIEGDDLQSFGDTFIRHVRSAHPDWPYPDVAVRNFAEATQRLNGPRERLGTVGEVTVHPVDETRIDDWLELFDHRAFVDNPAWASCYCAEPHVLAPGTRADEAEPRTWRDNRDLMAERLRAGESFGYLAYVDGIAAGWVNASRRSQYTLYCQGPEAAPADDEVIGVSCFAIAPPYRRHGLAAALLDRVIADAPARGGRWVEAYPFRSPEPGDAEHFRGPRALYDTRGFEQVDERQRHLVLRLQVRA